jgi:serine/threonine-protein kinase
MDRVVALKVLPPVLAGNPRYVERFMAEVRALARLSHENIVAAFDAGRSGSYAYLVMEFVKGNTLAKIIERGGALDERRVARIGLQVTRALDHAHRHRMLHRDLKPENIILSTTGAAKLCDMGFATLLTEVEDLGEGLTLGTPLYISPEQARGETDIDIRSDIYSLGATLYHAVTGTPPFTGKGAAEIMMRHITDYLDSPSERNEDVSEELSFIIKKMMRKNPEKRYRTPKELAADLEAFEEDDFEVPTSWFTDSSLNLRAQKAKSAPEKRRAPRARRKRKRRR